MNRDSVSSAVVALLCGWLGLAAPAAALPQRTFVSAGGNDVNPCSLASPCRTLQRGVNAVAAGGDLIVLDSAGYGAVDIPKSVNIFAPDGVYAGISVTSGDAVSIGAGGVNIVLRGLTINGNGLAFRGIYFFGDGQVHVENCVISGFGAEGFKSTAAPGSHVFIKDSFIRDTDIGISVGSGASASVDNVRAEHNRLGMVVNTGSTMTVRNSVAAGNQDGFYAITGNGSQATLTLKDCMASNNGIGVGENYSVVVLDNCVITGNTDVGVTGFNGLIYSRQNNTVYDNGTDVDATLTPLGGT